MNRSSKVYWITGLSGAGKSTICELLVEYLRNKGRIVIRLDGDELRAVLKAEHLHRRKDRLDLAMRYSGLCKMLASQGVDITIATISMFKEVYQWNRENLPGYTEIFLDVPIAELKKRDPKKIYERAEKNEIRNVAGVDLDVDYPENPDIRILHRPGKTAEHSFGEILKQLKF